MFRHFIAILLLTAFAAQTFQQVVIELTYQLNTAAFAKNCENKARPKMRCNGKCQLMKKLQEEEKKNNQHPERKLENNDEVALSLKSFYPVFNSPITLIKTCFSFYAEEEKEGAGSPVFHPPLA